MSRMLLAALDLAEAGWAVLPLDGKRPLKGSHGHLDASTDPRRIRSWWRDGDWNIGSPVPRSLLVLDVDPRNDGSLQALEQRAGVSLPPTLTVVSGRGDGGKHLYFLRPFEQPYRGSMPPGIDVKTNGYMVMPPSVHPESGRRYRWEEDDRPIARLPREVCALLLPRRQSVARRVPTATDVAALATWVRGLQPGERHDGLFWAASRAHEAGVGAHGLALLIDAAEDNGTNRREAQRVVESAGQGARS
jgi:hypothetical protein